MKGESLRRLDTELYEETNEKDSWGPRFPLADPSISSQVLVSRVIGQVPTAGQKRGSRKLVGLVPGSRHLASNPCVTASAFIAMNPEALPPPHSICFNATSRNESPDPEQPQTRRRARRTKAWELGLRTCFRSAASNGGAQHQRGYRPLGWKKGHHRSMVDRRSRFLESTTLF